MQFQNAEQIKEAVDLGYDVRWKNEGYVVYKDGIHLTGEYLITFTPNDSTIGLTWQDGVTLNGKPEEFYIHGTE